MQAQPCFYRHLKRFFAKKRSLRRHKQPKHQHLWKSKRPKDSEKDTQKYRNTEYSLFSEGITRRRKIMYNIFTIYIIYILYI